MLTWLTKWFKTEEKTKTDEVNREEPGNFPNTPKIKVGEQERVQIQDMIFLRVRVQDQSLFGRGTLPTYRYYCPDCGSELSHGPEGGMAVNAVCRKCRINYGCLPGYWGDH